MSQLILDSSDPAVAQMVAGWKEGGVYRLEVRATQGKTDGSLIPFAINEITDYGQPEGAPEEAAADEIEPVALAGGVGGGQPAAKVGPGLREGQ